MPQKTPQERARKSKARASTMVVRTTDVRDTGGKSNHATKKSKSIIRERSFYDRSVSHAAAPGEGLHREPEAGLHPDGAARRFRKSGRKKVLSTDRGNFPVATVNGRKKR